MPSNVDHASTCPECGNDPEVFMHEKNCSLADIPQEEPNVREQRIWRRFWLTPICLIRGHIPALIRPIVPNPYATESWVEGCGRCSRCPL
jgi:hypothetical protein